MSLRNLSIAPRAALGFGLVALLVILLGMFSLLQMSEKTPSSGKFSLPPTIVPTHMVSMPSKFSSV